MNLAMAKIVEQHPLCRDVFSGIFQVFFRRFSGAAQD